MIEPEHCPTPEYHETHRYCPSCSWRETQPTKAILEVRAGILPGEPMPELTRRWPLTAADVQDQDVYLSTMGHAMIYAQSLMDPARVNWVAHEWTWL